MCNWYVLYGFAHKEHMEDFLNLATEDDDGSSALRHGYYGEKYLGLVRLDIENIDSGALFDACPDATNFNYFVFWDVGIPHSKRFGFFDMEQ